MAEEQREQSRVNTISVFPLDDLVTELDLDQVDFIKMDIEGAEPRALRGAAATLKKFRPRLAVCTYHGDQDPVLVPEIIQAAEPSYEVQGRGIETQWYRVRPKVLYFHSDAAPRKAPG